MMRREMEASSRKINSYNNITKKRKYHRIRRETDKFLYQCRDGRIDGKMFFQQDLERAENPGDQVFIQLQTFVLF